MFSIVDFTEMYRFNSFAQSAISTNIEGIELIGRVDELIATGFRLPEIPFLRSTNTNTDKTIKVMLLGRHLPQCSWDNT